MQSFPNHRPKLLSISPVLCIIVVFFAAGICWAGSLPLQAEFLVYIILVLLGFLFIFRKRLTQQFTPFPSFLLGLLFFLLGVLQAQTHLIYPADPAHIYNLVQDQQQASLDGILLEYPSVALTSSGPETRLLMQLKSIYLLSGRKAQMQRWHSASGKVLLTLNGLLPEGLKPGSRFLAKTDVSRVNTYSTPGSFDYKKYLALQAIFIKGWIESPNDIITIHPAASSWLSATILGLRYLPERIRCHIAAFLDHTLAQPARGLYKAILIGDRNDVVPAVLENFIAAGCIHILAISGMHMGLLALVTIAAITWIMKRSAWLLLHAPVLKIAAAIALLPLLLYALIAGFNIPVLRALLMTSVLTVAILFDRPGNLINHILLAALLILAWKPGAIFTASFQLSFSAVLAIALIYPLLFPLLFQGFPVDSSIASSPGIGVNSPASLLRLLPITCHKWLLAGVAITTAAMLGTLPLLLFHFNRFSLAAPFSNLLVEPLICFWSLIIGLIASLFIPFFPFLAKSLFFAGSYGLIIAAKICAFFSAIPFSSLWFTTPSSGEIILAYFILLISVVAMYYTGKPRRYALIMALFCLCSLVTASAVTTAAKQFSGTTTVTFLDVGHGAAILLQLPGNKNILLDGGGAQGDRFNIGERVIAPYLWNQKLRRLDAVVITHPHADHYNGLPFILRRFRPRELWINGSRGHDKDYRELLALAGKLNIETRVAAADTTLFQSGPARLLCLYSGREATHQPDNFKQNRLMNPNDLSLVLRLETDKKSFLFPADISTEMATRLAREGKILKADVLLAPHHGSPSSMSPDFISTVAPDYIAISAGRNNPFNFPAKSFDDLRHQGIEVLSTGTDGTITFREEHRELRVSRHQIN